MNTSSAGIFSVIVWAVEYELDLLRRRREGAFRTCLLGFPAGSRWTFLWAIAVICFDAIAMLRMPVFCWSLVTGVDLIYPVTTRRPLFWLRSSCSMRRKATQGYQIGAVYVRRLSHISFYIFINWSLILPPLIRGEWGIYLAPDGCPDVLDVQAESKQPVQHDSEDSPLRIGRCW